MINTIAKVRRAKRRLLGRSNAEEAIRIGRDISPNKVRDIHDERSIVVSGKGNLLEMAERDALVSRERSSPRCKPITPKCC